jgi:hypothetical protein
MPHNQDFASKVLTDINILSTTGKNYRRVNHKLDNIKANYIQNMKNKYSNLGTNYLDKMTSNIETIFCKIIEKQNYDALEFINNVITWYFKCLAFKYNLIKIQPQIPESQPYVIGLDGKPTCGLPDYTIAEINDICKSLV